MRRLSPVPFTAVSLEDDFWRERLDTVLTRTIPSQYEKLRSSGILESLTIPEPPPPLRIPPGQHGLSMQVFWDSDVGKWIEAASYALAHRRDATIEAQIDEITEWLARAQLPDGYLNCWYIGRHPEQRWSNLRDCHELYCAGHLLEGAIAYHQATGRRRLLDILCRYVDHIAEVFGPGPRQKHGYCGHQEIELALYEYSQSHKPVREQDKVVGHAVRAMYMYSAMADLAAALDDAALKQACEVLWRDVTSKRMYVTAGIGPSASNEGFTQDYDLPNETAYAETCASVALIFWAQRMLHLEGDGRYADVLETALYNGALSGLSRDGTHYFYQNPLASDGSHTRWQWHPCPCCTMNVSRLVASVGGYFYSSSDDAVAVHLYGASTASLKVAGQPIRIVQESDYPWSGKIRIAVESETPIRFLLKLRIPGWARECSVAVNGAAQKTPPAVHGYLELDRSWQTGDVVDLELPMPVERIHAHPLVQADVGRVSLRRGPLMYCVEQVDHAETAVGLLRLPGQAELRSEQRPDLFGGIVTVVADAAAAAPEPAAGDLYTTQAYTTRPARLTGVPYYLWNNRGANVMQVWLPVA